MSAVRFAVAAVVVGLGVLGWQKHQEHAEAAELAAITDARGFTTFPTPQGASPKTVWVIAAQNCPSDGAQRADALARQLAERNMSYDRRSSISFSVLPSDNAGVEALTKHYSVISRRETPIVYVNGKVKANPDLDEVIAEYNEAQQL